MSSEIFVRGGAGMDKPKTGYSHFFFTDMTSKLNRMYSIDEAVVDVLTGNSPLRVFSGEVPVPMTTETFEKLRGATIMHTASQHQANYVIGHFIDVAMRIGQFAALPYDEIAEAARIPQHYVDLAAKESYFRIGETTFINGKPLRFLELTDRLFPVN